MMPFQPLFCGDQCPSRRDKVCTLDPFHSGSHQVEVDGLYIQWEKTPTVPEMRAAEQVPPTLRPILSQASRCYYCDAHAVELVNYDVPTCGGHRK